MYQQKIYHPNSFYHLYNRGNRKNLIYFQQEDYSRFLSLQYRFLKFYNLMIYSYCLMPNHFHILINSGSKPEEITSYMHRFMTSYAIYLNRKYQLVGRVFQSPYKAKYIPNKEVLKKVSTYIKGNPVKAGLVRNSYDYKWLMEASIVDIV